MIADNVIHIGTHTGRANTPRAKYLLINRYVSPFLSSPETDLFNSPFIPLPTLPSTSKTSRQDNISGTPTRG